MPFERPVEPASQSLTPHARRVLVGALLIATALLGLGPGAATAAAQEAASTTVDSIVVEGEGRLTDPQIIGTAGIAVGQSVNYRDIQRAVRNLFRTGQFDDVVVEQRDVNGKLILAFRVTERPLLERWAVTGTDRISLGTVKDRVRLREARPIDRNAVERARTAIDSMYIDRGYYAAQVTVKETATPSGAVRVVFEVSEGQRVAVGQVAIEGNSRFDDKTISKHMGTRPEGFWWFQKGDYDEERLEQDMRERLPRWYAENGQIDFRVLSHELVPDSVTGKALLKLEVEEGPVYQVATFEISGNRRFSTDDLATRYPFGGKEAVGLPGEQLPVAGVPFNQTAWIEATDEVHSLYANNGYIYATVQPEETRRTATDGTQVVDLRWVIREGAPATVNKINIIGNDVTHERVVREAILLAPGSLFSRDLLIRSYQQISSLGFFQEPLPPPDVQQAPNGQDVDITFRIQERRTGNINFGASVGQGTGLGGFLGLEEPNLFGRGKRGRLQWQFGRNINDFTLSYTDPAIRESRISGTISLFNSRQRFTIEDLGRRRQVGGSIRVGFPFFGSRFTRVFGSYGLQLIKFTEGSEDLRGRFSCTNCTRSTLGGSILRDTRIGLPFASGGALINTSLELNGGILGGTGSYRKIDLEGRWYAPLGRMGGGEGDFAGGVMFVLGLTAKSGWIFGDAGPFFTELYSMGGTQFGVPLRGYEEFAITPDGFNPSAGGNNAPPDAFGKTYAAFTLEVGARISQSLYVSSFLDAGNVYREPEQYDPTRLFRGAGFGVALLSPLGPIGIDLGYGFDRVDLRGNPDPGWKLHFKLGNFF